MRILLTNTSLVERGGTELYIRDLALALLRRGHQPLVYSPRLGAVAAEIRAATVPVVDRLEALGAPPDLIHGQHHLETMTALLHFPQVPAVFFSHGWQPWQEAPPRFPRIRHYVAVSEAIRDCLVYEYAIPPTQVTRIPNFVDLEKFHLRSELVTSPRRALAFSNALDTEYLAAVKVACDRHHLILDTAGTSTENVTVAPETLLLNYDLVFAQGRSALEALATGAAVIVAGPAGVAALATSENLELFRRLNFGLRALRQPCTADVLSAEISRYDATDVAKVSQKLRATAGLDQAVTQIMAVYEQVLENWSPSCVDLVAEQQATAAYLHWVSSKNLVALFNHTHNVENLYQAGLQQIQTQATIIADQQAEGAAMQQKLQIVIQESQRTQEEIQAMRQTRGWRLLSRWWQVKRLLRGQSATSDDTTPAAK